MRADGRPSGVAVARVMASGLMRPAASAAANQVRNCSTGSGLTVLSRRSIIAWFGAMATGVYQRAFLGVYEISPRCRDRRGTGGRSHTRPRTGKTPLDGMLLKKISKRLTSLTPSAPIGG